MHALPWTHAFLSRVVTALLLCSVVVGGQLTNTNVIKHRLTVLAEMQEGHLLHETNEIKDFINENGKLRILMYF